MPNLVLLTLKQTCFQVDHPRRESRNLDRGLERLRRGSRADVSRDVPFPGPRLDLVDADADPDHRAAATFQRRRQQRPCRQQRRRHHRRLVVSVYRHDHGEFGFSIVWVSYSKKQLSFSRERARFLVHRIFFNSLAHNQLLE